MVLVVLVAVAVAVPVLHWPAVDLRQIGWFFRTSLLLKQNLSGALTYKTDGRGAVLIGVGRYLGTSMAWSPPFLPRSWRNSGFCGAPSENHLCLWGPFQTERCCYSTKMLKISLLLTLPHLLLTFIEIEQLGRIKSHPGDLSFEVTILSPMITTEKKHWAWKLFLFCLQDRLFSTPRQ